MTPDPRSPAAATPSSELSHTAIGQWGGIGAGVLAGFAVSVMLATLGSALGLTAGAAAIDEAGTGTDGGTAAAFGGGAVAWILISAVIVGTVGGIVLARSARPDRAFNALLLGLVTWTGGVLLAILVAAPAAGGLASGFGASAGAATAYFAPQGGGSNAGARSSDPAGARPADPGAAGGTRQLTNEERAQLRTAAEDTARAVSGAAWAAFVAQVISLLATIGAAKWQRRRLIAHEPVGYVVPAHGV